MRNFAIILACALSLLASVSLSQENQYDAAAETDDGPHFESLHGIEHDEIDLTDEEEEAIARMAEGEDYSEREEDLDIIDRMADEEDAEEGEEGEGEIGDLVERMKEDEEDDVDVGENSDRQEMDDEEYGEKDELEE